MRSLLFILAILAVIGSGLFLLDRYAFAGELVHWAVTPADDAARERIFAAMALRHPRSTECRGCHSYEGFPPLHGHLPSAFTDPPPAPWN